MKELQQKLQCLQDLMLHLQKSQLLREVNLFKYLNEKINLLIDAVPNIDKVTLEKLHQEFKERCDSDEKESAKEYDKMRDSVLRQEW